jgi:hypothetical protein
MINGSSNVQVRPPDEAWRKPQADGGAFSVVASDRIGADPRQLDLWPSPPPKQGTFNVIQAAFDGWKPGKPSVEDAKPEPHADQSARPKFLLLDSDFPPPQPKAAWEGIEIGERDEFVPPRPSAVIRVLRPGIVAAALVAALIVGWAGGWGSYHMLASVPAAPQDRASIADCAGAAQNITCALTKSDPGSTTAAGASQKATPAAANRAARAPEPARAASASAPDASSPATTGSVARERARMSPRPVAVPETRPTTIEGWTVREVVGGTVVLEGPDGVWRAARGETVPGVGRVDSIVRWGNRWIVATSKGLISTSN